MVLESERLAEKLAIFDVQKHSVAGWSFHVGISV